ncbi:HIT domain-containing protein [Cryobacterium sp. M15]|uniref:HIT family protein n=1 Tax=Cryobacterium sp. M15 TaxID=2048291 RepID=UPI000CE4A293
MAACLGVGLQRVARRLEDRLQPDGLTLFQSNRSAGWQTVFHAHFHLVPKATNWFRRGRSGMATTKTRRPPARFTCR